MWPVHLKACAANAHPHQPPTLIVECPLLVMEEVSSGCAESYVTYGKQRAPAVFSRRPPSVDKRSGIECTEIGSVIRLLCQKLPSPYLSWLNHAPEKKKYLFGWCVRYDTVTKRYRPLPNTHHMGVSFAITGYRKT
jgi:hypothetical protein